MEHVVFTLIIGTGATIVMDLWGIIRKQLFDIALPNYRLVGRWVAHMPRGRIRHQAIAEAPPIRGEQIIGWITHYLTGIAFAALLIAMWGLEWVRHPTPGPAIIVGIGSVVAPVLLMQPAMGAGVASSRTRNPAAARLQSLITHLFFGLGLYATGWVTNFSIHY